MPQETSPSTLIRFVNAYVFLSFKRILEEISLPDITLRQILLIKNSKANIGNPYVVL